MTEKEFVRMQNEPWDRLSKEVARQREAAAITHQALDRYGFNNGDWLYRAIAAALREAEARGYARGIEEAAALADGDPRVWKKYDGDFEANLVAAAIRSLIAPEKQP